ncbi:MAG: archaeosortase/exosortase family protein [Candidatus Bathyarchaeota archaeon]|nr:archaeosortase/exosortase family protein [Candidatus Bathyarchaeota archaeon]
MQAVLPFLKKHENALLKLLPLMAFVLPLLWLYLLDAGSFELMWKGRTFQIFFVWLIVLELILGWESIQPTHTTKLFSAKTLVLIAALLLPTVYVILANYLGLNTAISEASRQSGVVWWDSMTLSTEYLVFTALFCVIVYLQFGKKGLKDFSVPAVFLGIVGALYTIDNVFPYGQFTPFQLLVPTAANLAASILNLMGYQTSLNAAGTMPRLTATNPVNPIQTATFDIAWPCAGIESLLIFTVVALLFLKRMHINWKAKFCYFAIGVAVTYSINILRIVTIFTIGMNEGDVQLFHFYYGPLYSITWIVSYPLVILGSQILWRKIASKNAPPTKKSQPPQPNPA